MRGCTPSHCAGPVCTLLSLTLMHTNHTLCAVVVQVELLAARDPTRVRNRSLYVPSARERLEASGVKVFVGRWLDGPTYVHTLASTKLWFATTEQWDRAPGSSHTLCLLPCPARPLHARHCL